MVLDALAPIPVGNYHPRICWELPSSLEIDLLGDGILNPEFKVIWYAGVIEWDPEGYDLSPRAQAICGQISWA